MAGSMTRFSILSLGILFTSATHAVDLKAAKTFAKAKGCFQCHGSTGNTGHETDPPVPKLAGQPKAYLVKTMKDYRSGTRESSDMNVMLAPRTDEEIDLLAEYFSAQKRY